jgi:hypothetical protein
MGVMSLSIFAKNEGYGLIPLFDFKLQKATFERGQ